jgi:hypothetical protein
MENNEQAGAAVSIDLGDARWGTVGEGAVSKVQDFAQDRLQVAWAFSEGKA